MMTKEQYIESLRKMKLNVWYMGEKIENPVDHPMIRPSLNSVAMTYELAEQPEYQEVMTAVSNLTGKRLGNSAFEIGGGRPKVFSIALERKLLGQLVYEGKPYEFNFSKPWTGSVTRFSACETERDVVWHVEQETLFSALVTDIHCPKSDMLFVNYEAPDGAKRHNRLWNGGTGTGTIKLYTRRGKAWDLVDEVKAEGIGCEYGEYDS